MFWGVVCSSERPGSGWIDIRIGQQGAKHHTTKAFLPHQRVTTEGKAMEFSDIHASMLIMTDRENQLSSDMQGDWKVLRVDDLSFTISRPEGGQEEHFSPCASINFIAA
ncbi:hypothetical protein AN659_0219675 [Enterobacter sp. ST121:950178628]|nr:hypothetical protein AN659_0219675 [Enterobacter sp. ST121:950178628]